MANILLKAVSPGHAELHISPWEDGTGDVELSVRRSEGEPYLDVANRRWVGDEQWVRLQGAACSGQTLVMPVGPDFVDTLLAGTQGPRCRGYVRVGGGEPVQHGFRVEADVLPSSAAGHAPTVGGSSQISAPARAPEPAVALEPPVVADPPKVAPPPAPPVKRSALPWLLAVLVLLAAAAAAVYVFVLKDKKPEEPAKPETPPPAAAAPEPPAAGCTPANLAGAGADVMSFVQTCVRDVKDSAALLAVIRAARDAGQCEIAQRLYANRANAGDVAITLAYAQEYDPAQSRSACFKPEAATARYWYESILEKDPQHAEAQAKLKALPN